MIGYTMIGTNNPAAATAFYTKLLAMVGGAPLPAYSSETRTFFSSGAGQPMIAVGKPYDGSVATIGNGTMTALAAPSRAVVDAMYAAAIAAGGKDEGAPGVRGPNPNGFYGAYFRDLDGNKICAFKVGPA